MGLALGATKTIKISYTIRSLGRARDPPNPLPDGFPRGLAALHLSDLTPSPFRSMDFLRVLVLDDFSRRIPSAASTQ